jgi:hypothetical protein
MSGPARDLAAGVTSSIEFERRRQRMISRLCPSRNAIRRTGRLLTALPCSAAPEVACHFPALTAPTMMPNWSEPQRHRSGRWINGTSPCPPAARAWRSSRTVCWQARHQADTS